MKINILCLYASLLCFRVFLRVKQSEFSKKEKRKKIFFSVEKRNYIREWSNVFNQTITKGGIY